MTRRTYLTVARAIAEGHVTHKQLCVALKLSSHAITNAMVTLKRSTGTRGPAIICPGQGSRDGQYTLTADGERLVRDGDAPKAVVPLLERCWPMPVQREARA